MKYLRAAAPLLSIVTACMSVGEVDPGSGPGSGSDPGSGGDPHGSPPAGFVFSAYKDTSINMNWNTNVITTNVPGSPTPLHMDLSAQQAGAITLAFATGECGTESWGGVPGPMIAQTNAPLMNSAGIKYVLATGGAAGSFSCGSDSGFAQFLDRWAGPGLIGVD
ncbi:MAG TPA: hypothetical protein VL463_02365, partial [Kofleriaceae bacterium]|nr:hypothetical protein [Kofleriaceae bacterium]